MKYLLVTPARLLYALLIFLTSVFFGFIYSFFYVIWHLKFPVFEEPLFEYTNSDLWEIINDNATYYKTPFHWALKINPYKNLPKNLDISN